MTRIILCMIVKNEARILSRCLTSALPMIDAACIVDTGSTDDTPEIARRALAEAGVPLKLCHHEWVNFGVNRSRSFVEARAFAQELGWDLERSYALFLDADMILHLTQTFDRDELTADSYTIRQGDGSFQYDNLRLAKLSRDWRSVGATHEYWTSADAATQERLVTAWILDVGDGGSKADKFERDIHLLEAELKEQPDNPRTLFYLAQSYYDAGRYADARCLYERRAGMAGWEEEGWYAAFRMGMCSLQLDEWDRAAGELLVAWQRRPSRAEPLYQLSRAARIRGASHIAMLAAERALDIPLPREDTLFIDGTAYGVGPTEEISISAYYTGQRERGMAACEALLHSRAVPPQVKTLAAANSSYYAQPIPRAEARRVDIPHDLILPTFSPSVGSICRTDDGYVMVNRMLNYYITSRVEFITRDPGGQYFSKSLWLTLDRDLQLTSATTIDDSIVEDIATVPARDARVLGLEDIRLIRWRDGWWFTGSSSQFHPKNLPRVIFGRIDPDGPRYDHVVPLSVASPQFIEKNWIPFIHEGRLLLLYSCDPTVILEPDIETGVCREVHREPAAIDLSRYRGSSPLLPLEGGRYLFIGHEVSALNETRVYLHRFVEMDASLRITRASRLFSYQHIGVEYTCGLCLSHDEQHFIISCNWQERESWLVSVPRRQVEDMLLPIEELAHFGEGAMSAASLITPDDLKDFAPKLASPSRNGSAERAGQPGGRSPHVSAARRQPHRRWPRLGLRRSGSG